MSSPTSTVTAMAPKSTSRRSPRFRCAECGWTTVKWVGRCGECQAWGSVAEVEGASAPRTAAASVGTPAVRIADVDLSTATARPTGVPEFDRVLGGGLVAGGVVLVAGEPGVGKSTLLLDVAARAARGGAATLYVSGEESAPQVRARAGRIDALADSLYLAAETDLATVLGHIEASAPELLVVDSVQTIASSDVEGQAGNVSQVREVAVSLIRAAKERGIAVLLAGMMAPPNMGPDYAARFNPIYPDLAKEHNLVFYPFFLDGVVTEVGLKLDDGMHPNGGGVGVMVERFLPTAELFVRSLAKGE